MNLEKLVAVSKLPGIFKVVKNKNNGLIVQSLDNGKKRFVSSRSHQFTPLETISIYTEDDTAELKEVFKTMKEKVADLAPITNASSSEEAKNYFEQILPNYDKDKVYVSDIKKIAKWFTFLNNKGLLEDSEPEATDTNETQPEATDTSEKE